MGYLAWFHHLMKLDGQDEEPFFEKDHDFSIKIVEEIIPNSSVINQKNAINQSTEIIEEEKQPNLQNMSQTNQR